MLPWRMYQSYLSVRSRIRDVINLTYDVIEVTRYHWWALYTLNIQPRCIKTQHSMQHWTRKTLVRFHAATIDSFDAIDSWSWKIMEFAKIWPLTCHNWVKYWPRTKNNTTNREYSARAICWSFPRSSKTLRLETSRGGRTNPPPLHRRRWQNTVYGRGLISVSYLV